MNPWLVVALIVALVLLVSAILVVSQPALLHTIGAALRGPQQMAPVCPGSTLPC